jgi:hypothetical protein
LNDDGTFNTNAGPHFQVCVSLRKTAVVLTRIHCRE